MLANHQLRAPGVRLVKIQTETAKYDQSYAGEPIHCCAGGSGLSFKEFRQLLAHFPPIKQRNPGQKKERGSGTSILSQSQRLARIVCFL
jgi:hypothetical protein